MLEYIECGVKLGWLINPDTHEVAIYRLAKEKKILHDLSTLSGEQLSSGLTVNFTDIF